LQAIQDPHTTWSTTHQITSPFCWDAWKTAIVKSPLPLQSIWMLEKDFYCVSEALEVDVRIDYEGLARYDG